MHIVALSKYTRGSFSKYYSPKIESVKNEINRVRMKLENLVTQKSLTSDEVQSISQELDKLIVFYEKLISKKPLL